MFNPFQWLRDLAVREHGDHASKLRQAVYCVAAIIVAIVLWKVPQRQSLQPKDQFAQENAARTTLAQILGGTVLLGGLYTSVKTFGLSRQGHITDRFTKAIEQLGKTDGTTPNIEVRLGAIYSLERIALDSPRDHWTIMEVLTAYVRQNAPLDPNRPYTEGERPRTDIQAILTVLGRRETGPNRERFGQSLDLTKSRLCGANLRKANLRWVDLGQTNLQWARLRQANLQQAKLVGANLEGARPVEANLRETDLADAVLHNTFLALADLRDAHVTVDQIKSAQQWTEANYSSTFRAELGLPPESDGGV